MVAASRFTTELEAKVPNNSSRSASAISSGQGLRTSKAAIVMLMRNMAMDFAKDRARVNALCPGATLTPRIQANMAKRDPAHEQTLMNLIPMKRRANPQEIPKTAVFLASDDGSYITGAALVVDGGLTAGIRFPFFDDN